MSQCDDFMMFQVSVLDEANVFPSFSHYLFYLLKMAMKEMRQIDDNIVYALNNSIPTVSFKGQIDAATKCQELCSKVSLESVSFIKVTNACLPQIESTYDLREGALSKCIAFYQEKVNEAKSSANRTGQRIAQTHVSFCDLFVTRQLAASNF